MEFKYTNEHKFKSNYSNMELTVIIKNMTKKLQSDF